MSRHDVGPREEWLAGLARDYADASDDARDDHEPAIEIPLLDEPDDLGAWTCCGGKRWHTDDCDQGPTPNQIIGRFTHCRPCEPDDTEDDDADTHRPPTAQTGVHLVWSPAPHGGLRGDDRDAHVAGPAGATGGHDDTLPVCGRVYIAGPMTGLPDHNYPAFHRAAATLRASGWHVESPADPGQVDGWTWADYMRRGLQQMLTCDTIALLPGWHTSRGALIEARLADTLGMPPVLVDDTGEVIR